MAILTKIDKGSEKIKIKGYIMQGEVAAWTNASLQIQKISYGNYREIELKIQYSGSYIS